MHQLKKHRNVGRPNAPNHEMLAARAEPLLRLRQDAIDHFEMILGRGGVERFHAHGARIPRSSPSAATRPSAQMAASATGVPWPRAQTAAIPKPKAPQSINSLPAQCASFRITEYILASRVVCVLDYSTFTTR